MLPQKCKAQLRNLSVELGLGLVNGGCFRPYPKFDGCHECELKILEHQGLPGLATNVAASIGIDRRNSIGMGFLLNQVRFEQGKMKTGQSIGVQLGFSTFQLDYLSWQFSHSYRLLSGKKLELALSNGIMYEHLLKATLDKSVATEFREKNLSLVLKLEFHLKMDKRNKLVFSPIAILPLNDYQNSEYIKTDYRPFRHGLTIGWRSLLKGETSYF
jgi:hypothetical protein